MVPRLGGFPGGASQRAENLSISEYVFRATVGATSRNCGASETSTSPGTATNPEHSGIVIADQESLTKTSRAKSPTEETRTTKATVLEPSQPLLATSSGRKKTVADEETPVSSAPISTSQENSRSLSEGNRSIEATVLEKTQSLIATSSSHEKTVADEETAVGSASISTGENKSRLALSLRHRPRIPYPETIEDNLPDSFLSGDGDRSGDSLIQKPESVDWWLEIATPFPAGWNPNLVIRQQVKPLRSQHISLRFHKARLTLLRLPPELRVHILRHLLRRTTPITDPCVVNNEASKENRTPANNVSILRTCRRIYLEGSPILYQKNTFRFTESKSWISFYLSRFPVHRDGIRHLELDTLVAEHYCHRIYRVQGQRFRDIRIRGPARWDWPFTSPWPFPNLHTLKLELKAFSLLPLREPPLTRHFKPDKGTKAGRDALLTQYDVIKLIHDTCVTPKLRDVTVVGMADNPKGLLLIELKLLNYLVFDIECENMRHRRALRYLESRTGGRWETQDERVKAYWNAANVGKRIEEGSQSWFLDKDRVAPGDEQWHLAILMWMRRKVAKGAGDGAPAKKQPSLLWSW